MSVSGAAQILSASASHTSDFLRVDMTLGAFEGSKSTSDFIKKLIRFMTF